MFARAESFLPALIGMGLTGLGCSSVFMASLFIFAKTVPTERFGMTVSLLIGCGSAGNILGASPFALAVQAIGWRSTMMWIFAAFTLTTLLAALIVRDPPKDASAPPNEGVIKGLMSIFAIRPLWILMPLVAIAYAVLVSERGLWVGPFFGQVHGLDKLSQGNAAFAMAIAMTIGAPLFGWYEKLLGGPKFAVAIPAGIVVAAFLLLAFSNAAQPGGTTLAYLGVILVGLFGFSYGSLMAHARFFMPEHLIGRGMTFINFGFMGGSAVMQFASGSFIQSAQDKGTQPAEAFSGLHLIFALVLLSALVIYLFTPRRPTASIL